MPELATTSTAAIDGNASLAVNNILGGVSMQLAVLALADAVVGPRGLSTMAGSSALILQGNGLMLSLTLAAAAIVSGSVVVLGIDLWTIALLVVVILIFGSTRRYEREPVWEPATPDRDESLTEENSDDAQSERVLPETSNSRLVASTITAGLLVVAAGYLVTRAAEAVSMQTGLGAEFTGAVFLAGATSLPELSTTTAAVRLRRHKLAMSNIFGTNLFDVALLFVADAFYREGAALDEVGDFSLFGALLGIVLTGVFVVGTLQRTKRVVLRMGIDSALVIIIYVGGIAILYGLR